MTPRSYSRGAGGRRTAAHAAFVPDVLVTVTHSLGEALIERAGIRRDRRGAWVGPDGRRTSAIAEALIWRWWRLPQRAEGRRLQFCLAKRGRAARKGVGLLTVATEDSIGRR